MTFTTKWLNKRSNHIIAVSANPLEDFLSYRVNFGHLGSILKKDNA